MKRTSSLISIIILILTISSCKQGNEKKNNSNTRFDTTKEIAKQRDVALFDIFKRNLSPEEDSYLKFLYSFMPLSDLADYDGNFFLNHVKTSIKIKNEISWANKIPSDIYEHFVLPYRVNNENLDTARIVFYKALKDRIKGMTMYDAALEVNHWCHEKVEYHPADSRTSSPLATLKTAFGRCGEESTFAVAALRSVCIPARQVYTPRWAHSDDNHAWVEVWADGKWYFLGACEPAPVLNLGWFSKSASRAMLIHARVFGKYEGNEEVNLITSQYDDINVVDRYAHTFKQYVQVIDNKGNPIENANIEYQLYNYAEFYPITKKESDKNGISYLTTGMGELLIWVYNSTNYGFRKVIIGYEDTALIVLDSPKFEDTNWELMPPPASDKLKIDVSDEAIKNNKIALQREDSIRNTYVTSFISKEEFTSKYDEKFWKFIPKSRGNYGEIISFIETNSTNPWAEVLLSQIAEKDLRDTKADILNDHLLNAFPYAQRFSEEIFSKYVLNPRIELEMLLPYRSFFNENIRDELKTKIVESPQNLKIWIDNNIRIDNERQAYNLPISPIGVYNLGVSDKRSRNIFFVAACRSFGIASRLEKGTLLPQYLHKDKWVDVFFDGKPDIYKKFNVEFNVVDTGLKFTPQYYHHFTIAIFEDNRFNTLKYGEYQNIDEIKHIKLKNGLYRLITSNRLSSGKILVDMKFLNISSDTIIDLRFPENTNRNVVQGNIDRNILSEFLDYKDRKACSLQESSNIVIAFIRPDKEPSKHILNDIQKIKDDFEKLNSTIVFIIQKKDMSATFKVSNYPNLPYRTFFKVIDSNPNDLFNITTKQKSETYPKIMIARPNGDIYYLQEGYKIGVGNDLLRLL